MSDVPTASVLDAVEAAKVLVKMWLERHLLLYSHRYLKPSGDYSDLYVDRSEVDAFLAGQLGVDEERQQALAELAEREARFRERMLERFDAALGRGEWVPFEDLRAAFDVRDERLIDAVLALLVVEVDPEFVRAYSHAWCDFTKKDVHVGFLIELIGRSAEEKARLCDFFLARTHPLLRLEALELPPRSDTAGRGLMQRPVRLSDRVVEFLSGRRAPGTRITGLRGGLRGSDRPLDSVLLAEEVRETFLAAFRQLQSVRPEHRALYVHGPDGCGKRSLCHAAAGSLGLPLLVGDGAEFAEVDCEARLTALLREARLQNALPLIASAEALVPARNELHQPDRLTALERACAAYGRPVIVTGLRRLPELVHRFPRVLEVSLPFPDRAVQRELWRRALPDSASFSDGFGIDAIVERYSLTGGAIERVAAALAASTSGSRGRAPLTAVRLFPLIREQLRHRLGSVAVLVDRGFTWQDLVVPERTGERLRELVSYVHHREQIADAWGFGTKVSYGHGSAALFHGPPGTGKTMAASILANDLGLELFQIDLSRIVDKYVGETEKNLAQVFEEGSRSQAILLFDEADSLFAKRTSVKSSVDRYANLEVNFLLQQIEQYDGISILTTNYADVLDEAFKRRIRFKVEFPFPTQVERAELWKRIIPDAAPLAGDVSFTLLAERYELSGGHIKNVLLRAAAIAAEEGTDLSMDALVRAANREYRELGKLVRE